MRRLFIPFANVKRKRRINDQYFEEKKKANESMRLKDTQCNFDPKIQSKQHTNANTAVLNS